MVRYVILRKCIHEIPPLVSFHNTCFLAWFTPQKGRLRGVKLPSPEPWSPDLKPAQLHDDALTIASEDSYPNFWLDDGNDNWSDDDNVDNDAPPGAQSYHHTDTSIQTPSQHDTGHIEPDPPHASDNCPHMCEIFIKNVNGLGGRRDNKLEKITRL